MRNLRTSLSLLATMTFLLGGVYPAGIWLVGQTLFHDQANGSLIVEQGQVIGSELIAQSFASDKYFWPRPSATQGGPYQFFGSGASQLSAANPLYIETLRARAQNFSKTAKGELAPIDMITASASGLDPDLSPRSAQLQAGRIAKARGLKLQDVLELIDEHTETRTLGFLGEPRVNVLHLNLDLDHKIARDQ